MFSFLWYCICVLCVIHVHGYIILDRQSIEEENFRKNPDKYIIDDELALLKILKGVEDKGSRIGIMSDEKSPRGKRVVCINHGCDPLFK